MIPRAESIEARSDDSYWGLPKVLQQYYTPTEYAWLSDQEKAHLEDIECLPEMDNE